MRFRFVVLAIALAALSSLATWQWASGQGRGGAPGVISGFDIGFIPDREQGAGLAGEQYVRGNLYVRVDGRWVPVEFTRGRMQLLPLTP
jgi:hypothetical protein